MNEATFIVFAYGSNMSSARLRLRCASARPLGIAKLERYELHWHKQSNDGSGKCDIVASADPNTCVFGVLYEIASEEKLNLDRAEGLGQGYREIEVTVEHNANLVQTRAYQATATDPTLQPYSWYRSFVVLGAREHGLPTDYIALLEDIRVIDDPDRTRHDNYMRIIQELRP